MFAFGACVYLYRRMYPEGRNRLPSFSLRRLKIQKSYPVAMKIVDIYKSALGKYVAIRVVRLAVGSAFLRYLAISSKWVTEVAEIQNCFILSD